MESQRRRAERERRGGRKFWPAMGWISSSDHRRELEEGSRFDGRAADARLSRGRRCRRAPPAARISAPIAEGVAFQRRLESGVLTTEEASAEPGQGWVRAQGVSSGRGGARGCRPAARRGSRGGARAPNQAQKADAVVTGRPKGIGWPRARESRFCCELSSGGVGRDR